MSLGPFVLEIALSDGKASIDAFGMIIIQQGRPHGIIAVPGEAHLTPRDFAALQSLYNEFLRRGYTPAPPGTIRPM